jgi:hypothetical protein
MVATKTLDKTKMLSVIFDFFKQFKTWCGESPVTPSANELEKYFSKNLQMFNNGQLVVKGGAHYLDRLKQFQRKYSGFHISEPLEEPIVCGNQAALYYRIDLITRQGEKKQVYILGMLTMEDDKISRWVEVTNEKGTRPQWDA